MSSRFKSYDPNQMLLFPPSLQDWLPEDHLSYFISDLVDELDLSGIEDTYDGSQGGQPAYHPGMMTKLLLYSYSVGAPSSRKIERRTYEDVPTRVLAAGNHPDHDTIANFRNRHLTALAGIFVNVLQVCQQAGLVKLGHVALDGTKIKANASKHKAMSYGRMKSKEKELEKEVKRLLKEASVTDEQEDATYGKGKRGDELPDELRFRTKRLEKIREAMSVLEEEARKEAQEKRYEQQEKKKQKKLEGKRRGRPPKPPSDIPENKKQYNFTDPESRIMKDGATKAFMQGFNAQTAVDGYRQVIVATGVTQQTTDHHQLEPMLKAIQENTGEKPKKMSLDAGYFSEDNVKILEDKKIDGYIATGKEKHSRKSGPCPRGRPPKDLTIKEQMERKLLTKKGKQEYSKRKEIAEAPFGQIKQGRGFRQFLLRGLEKVQKEWDLICLTHNILKVYRSGYAIKS